MKSVNELIWKVEEGNKPNYMVLYGCDDGGGGGGCCCCCPNVIFCGPK